MKAGKGGVKGSGKGGARSGTASTFTPNWKRLLKTFLLSRAMDEKEETDLVPAKKVLYQFSARGHELAQILLGQALTHPLDAASAYYRSRPLLLTLGLDPEDAMAAPMGKSGGYSDGRDIGVVCNHPGREAKAGGTTGRRGPIVLPMAGDVGSQYTPAVGWAQGLRYRSEVLGEKGVDGAISVILGGEASVATNGFWSALTMATTLKLPVLFFIEDNGYGISVPGSFQTPGGNIVNNLYSFSGITLFDGDGTDPKEAAALIGQAVAHVRTWNGPALIRLSVPRLNGHSYQDNQSYKSEALLERERARDPLDALRRMLVPGQMDEYEWIRQALEAESIIVRIAEAAWARPDADPERILDFRMKEDGKPALFGGLDSVGYEHPASTELPQPESVRINIVEAIRRTLEDELATNPRLVVFGEDVGAKGGVHAATMGLQTRFGEQRVFDTSLSEEGIIGRAVGLAYSGLKPVAELQFRKYADPATEQLKNAGTVRWRTVNRFSAPIVVRVPGGFAKCGDPWHSESGESFFTHAPGWQVAYPSNAEDAAGLLRSAMRSENPTLFFEHRNLLDAKSARRPYPGDSYVVPFGVARQVKNGDSLTVVTWGAMVERCVEAAEQVEAGLSAEGLIGNGMGLGADRVVGSGSEPGAGSRIDILDLRTLSPWDREAVLASVKKTSRCLIVHEDGRTNGFGAEISATITEEAFQWLDAPVRRITSPDIPIPYAVNLMNAVIPGVEEIATVMMEMLKG